jgi:DNA-binding MltR family transcriptional regulator
VDFRRLLGECTMNAGLSKEQLELLRRAYIQDHVNRADAIIWACQLQQPLQMLLRTAMISDPKVDSLFDDSNGPLSSFGAQIRCAWALGLIDSELRRDLDYIRKIRNEFAHREEQTSFSSGRVRDWLQQLSPVKNQQVTITHYSMAEYDSVLSEIRLTLLSLVFHKYNVENSVEEIRTTLRTCIRDITDNVVRKATGGTA